MTLFSLFVTVVTVTAIINPFSSPHHTSTPKPKVTLATMVKVNSTTRRQPLLFSSKIRGVVVASFGFILPCLVLFSILDVKTMLFLRHSHMHVIDAVNSNPGSTSSTMEAVTLNMVTKVASGTEKVPMPLKAAPKETSATSPNTIVTEALKTKEKGTPKRTTTTCLDPKGPKPYILLARGRSGSGSTLQVLGTLTGQDIPGDHEYAGENPKQLEQFFRKIGPNDGGKWILDDLCEQQRKHPEAGLVAFKWKPYGEATFSPAALAGFDLISRAVDPPIKVVRLRRNLLDNYISDRKHERAKIISHCKVGSKGYKACIEKHKQVGSNLTLSVKDLVEFLETETLQEDKVDELLVNMSVPHVQVTYEKLYHQGDAEEWMKIFQFLGVGPGTGLTREQVDGIMTHAWTSSPHHRESIFNFEEVKKALEGTRFESLLHP